LTRARRIGTTKSMGNHDSKKRFSGDDALDAEAEALYQAPMGSGLQPGEVGLSVENYAQNVADIMATPAPAKFTLHYTTNRAALVTIEPEGDDNGVDVWDQVTINGVHCGNRCGGRQVFTAMAFPYIVDRICPHSAEGELGEGTRVNYRDAARAARASLREGA